MSEKQYPTIEEFLRARNRDAAWTIHALLNRTKINHDEFEELMKANVAMAQIIDWHANWPILVETKPEFEADLSDLTSMSMMVSKKIAWMTQEEYRKHFGSEPPTAPLLAKMAMSHKNHPDWNPAWEVE